MLCVCINKPLNTTTRRALSLHQVGPGIGRGCMYSCAGQDRRSLKLHMNKTGHKQGYYEQCGWTQGDTRAHTPRHIHTQNNEGLSGLLFWAHTHTKPNSLVTAAATTVSCLLARLDRGHTCTQYRTQCRTCAHEGTHTKHPGGWADWRGCKKSINKVSQAGSRGWITAMPCTRQGIV